MAMLLSEEEKRKIEENRQQALKRRAERLLEAEKLKNSFKNGTAPLANPKTFYKQPVSSSPKNVPSKLYSFNEKSSSSNGGNYTPLKANINPSTTSISSSTSGKSSNEQAQKTWNVLTDALTGTVSLVSKDRFVLDIGFNSKLIDMCKSIPGRVYGKFLLFVCSIYCPASMCSIYFARIEI